MTFIKALNQLDKLLDNHGQARRKLQDDFDKALQDSYKAEYPRRKFTASKSQENNAQEHDRILAEYSELARVMTEKQSKIEKTAREQLDKIAARSSLPVTKKMNRYASVSSSAYNTQGFGAHRYAKESAQQYLDKALAYGLQGEIRPVETDSGKDCTGHSYRTVDYQVWVTLSKAGCKLLRMKPGTGNLLDWAVTCWRRGTNPKVYNPFLPHDISEEACRIAMAQ